MEPDINLHNIFRHLLGDPKFLLVENEMGASKKKAVGLVDIISDNSSLSIFERQSYEHMSPIMKLFAMEKYQRLGVLNSIERSNGTFNCSFLASINILLRPDLYSKAAEEHEKAQSLLEAFITHTLERNYRIDRVKNTKKNKEINRAMIARLMSGEITDDIVQSVVNIFEINLIMVDCTNDHITMYLTCGTRYPNVNFFKNVHIMCKNGSEYQPLMVFNETYDRINENRRIYTKLFKYYFLTSIRPYPIRSYPSLSFNCDTLIYLRTWEDQTLFQLFLSKFVVPEIKIVDIPVGNIQK
jgi:hypothetical protein